MWEFRLVMAFGKKLCLNVCFSLNAPVAPPCGQQVRARVGAVLDDGISSAEAAGGVAVHQGGESVANDLLWCLYNSLQPLPLCNSAAAMPYYSMMQYVNRLSGRRSAAGQCFKFSG